MLYTHYKVFVLCLFVCNHSFIVLNTKEECKWCEEMNRNVFWWMYKTRGWKDIRTCLYTQTGCDLSLLQRVSFSSSPLVDLSKSTASLIYPKHLYPPTSAHRQKQAHAHICLSVVKHSPSEDEKPCVTRSNWPLYKMEKYTQCVAVWRAAESLWHESEPGDQSCVPAEECQDPRIPVSC